MATAVPQLKIIKRTSFEARFFYALADLAEVSLVGFFSQTN